jgi:glycosyltransferase involved in cell wall biosynthesis
LRILWLSHFVPWPLRGGASIRSFHLVRELARGAEISFLSLNQRALVPVGEPLEEARDALAGSCARVRFLDIPAERFPFMKERVIARSLLSGSYDEVWLRSRAMARAVTEEIASFRPSVLHMDTVGMAQYAARAGEIPLVLNHHNIESHMMRRRANASRNPALRALLALQAKRLEAAERATARFDLHITVSELDRKRLLEIDPAITAEVIPNGVDTDYFSARSSQRDTVPHSMIFVGGLHWYPNRSAVEWLLQAIVPRLAIDCPDFRLIVVGRSPTPEMTAAAARDPRIECTGEIPDIRARVGESAVFVCPMIEGGGTRLKVLDAMAQGIPMVATTMAVEGIPVVSGRHALLADDPAEICGAILRLFRDPDLASRLAREARRFVEQEFAWPAVGDRLRGSYSRMLDRRGAPALQSAGGAS